MYYKIKKKNFSFEEFNLSSRLKIIMTLREKIETNYKSSLKSKDKIEISTYRLILSSIKDLDIANRSGPDKKETNDEDVKKLLKKMIKQRSESIEIYKKNDRKDLLEIEQNEFELISNFLPQQLSDEETKKICAEIIDKLGAESIKDIGKVNYLPSIGGIRNNFLISSY